MVWQIEWFANKAGTTIGTLALGKADVPAATAVGMLLQRCGYKIVSAQVTPSRCPTPTKSYSNAAPRQQNPVSTIADGAGICVI